MGTSQTNGFRFWRLVQVLATVVVLVSGAVLFIGVAKFAVAIGSGNGEPVNGQLVFGLFFLVGGFVTAWFAKAIDYVIGS